MKKSLSMMRLLWLMELEKCKYCGVQAVKDIHDLALKLRYVINDKDYYTDEMKLKLVFI